MKFHETGSRYQLTSSRFLLLLAACMAVFGGLGVSRVQAELKAGAAKIDITNRDVAEPPEHLWARALVLSDGETTAVIVTLDVVAIAEIGPIKNDFLPTVRAALKQDLQLDPTRLLVNASHCHGVVCTDVADRTIAVVKQAYEKLEPVRVGWGTGFENRVMENRRLLLKNGKQVDVRHAYSLPADEEVAEIGPIDPEIGVLRLDRLNGETLAVLYNFACHPILGTPRTAGNTADMTGYASAVIEDNLSPDTIALFVQGCAGDINPIMYKDVSVPRHAEHLGNRLGLSTLKAIRQIKCTTTTDFKMLHTTLQLPRADHTSRIASLQTEQDRLVEALTGTSLNLKTFVPLLVKYKLSEKYPSYYSHGYLHDQLIGRDDWERLDAENRRNLEAYIRNIHTMEELTRVKTNVNLLKRHQAKSEALNATTVDAEILGLRVGEFTLVTFPGELTVQIGLDIKQNAPRDATFVAGYTNGYLYYAPTDDQLNNPGCAQEDCDSLVGPGWLQLFTAQVEEFLKQL
ncbi:hypothetical protein [Rubinisphaera italica]|uniref:Neutral/alkaline non-lysosomal ceramidase n=1 Tax=Rubinisphaera italica TaxID=2527969 RepID=A0A5C5XEL4_9PLAN|nr:hypothetical protein [Rubinisphaera italica]TWT60555.1 Neutral/alkaline non-lysosomal ceramidase [Rubinisphaera italica]